ncbi:MAG: RpiB/LacA/LacB family sugar-phosphate isomerase, partial [Victivallales bacterium]
MRKITDWVGKKVLTIAIAGDHGGLEFKNKLISKLNGMGHKTIDAGPFKADPCDDYSDFGAELGFAIVKGKADCGILICRSGVGMGITANRFHNVRAAVVSDANVAKSSRDHNCSNVLVIPADLISFEDAEKIVKTWMSTPFSKDERHVRRLEKVETKTYDETAAVREV